MNSFVHNFIALVESNKAINTKEEMRRIVQSKFNLVRDGRSLYYNDFFAVRFCYSKNRSFSNTVLSLSKLQKYDHIPCFVVLVRKDFDNLIYLINSSLIERISHSSKELSICNIKGSLNGSDIRKNIQEIDKENKPQDFDDLFRYHQSFSWQENLERLVEITNNIKPNVQKVELSDSERFFLFDSPQRALGFIESENYNILLKELKDRCSEVKDAILIASHIENVNIRGRLIEALITANKEDRTQILQALRDTEKLLPVYDTKNELGDYTRSFVGSDTYTDIKTKVLYLDSNPKAYNVDKFLKCMGEEKSVFLFFFVGVDDTQVVNTILCSVYHNELLEKTRLQHHWAGRSSRGVAQFEGKVINSLLEREAFSNQINIDNCHSFLQRLLDR